ncbi:MAG: FAD:protein FMN transferase, partial [Phycisphaerales bacterium]
MRTASRQPALSILISVVVGAILYIGSMGGCQTTGTPGPDAQRPEGQVTLNRYRFARILMGSRCEIVLYGPKEPAAAGAAGAAFDEIARIERVLSDYDERSEAMVLMSREPGVWHEVSMTLLDVLLMSRDIHMRSEGAFDPTVGAYTHLWRQARAEQRISKRVELNERADSVGMAHLRIDPMAGKVRFDAREMVLDFGGIGKGYAAQAALDLLIDQGFAISSVDMGGDLAFGDPPPDRPVGWRVEIATGLRDSRSVHLANCAVATSGDLERYFEVDGERYSHILDPRTGVGIRQRRAVTVIAPDAAMADALASAA